MDMTKLIKLVKYAGVIALEEQKNMVISTKSDTSIVTNGDLRVSSFLEKELVKLYPDFEVFSEENTKNIPKGKKVIVIDPIDGTQSYSRKQDTWSILIGFLDDNNPVAGLIYQPTTETLYYATKGKGAYVIQDGQTSRLTGDRLGNIKAFSSPTRTGENEFLNKMNIFEIEHMYSAALKIMEIAKGNADIYPNFQKKCSMWDLIAPLVILKEVGGDIIYEDKIEVNFKKPSVSTRFCAVGKRLINFKF